MDTEVCGLNKLIVIGCANGRTVEVKSGTNKWTRTVQNGQAVFTIPSIPAPGKKTFTATCDGKSVSFELGFGDVRTINLDANAINDDDIMVGSGLVKSGNTISHVSGAASGTYGGGSSLLIPRFTVDSFGHVTSASNQGISTASVVSNSSNLLQAKAVYDLLGGTKLSDGIKVVEKSTTQTIKVTSIGMDVKNDFIGFSTGEYSGSFNANNITNYVPVGVVGFYNSEGVSLEYCRVSNGIINYKVKYTDIDIQANTAAVTGNISKYDQSVQLKFYVLYVSNV